MFHFQFSLFLFALRRGGGRRERALITNPTFLSAILFSILYNLYSWTGKCLLWNVKRRCCMLCLGKTDLGFSRSRILRGLETHSGEHRGGAVLFSVPWCLEEAGFPSALAPTSCVLSPLAQVNSQMTTKVGLRGLGWGLMAGLLEGPLHGAGFTPHLAGPLLR